MFALRKKSFAFVILIVVGLATGLKYFLAREVKVKLDYGSFIGKVQRSAGLERFYGIPFAEPPVGELRFANPIKPRKKYYNHDCTKHAPSCPQQSFTGNTSIAPYQGWLNDEETLHLANRIRPFGPGQEDCLTLDIARPAGTTRSSRLPVMFFLFPGGFNYGTSWELSPKSIVKKSVSMGMPIIHVTANYRLNAFGFLGGREVAKAGVGNLGLKDQRLTLEWIKTYISEFGGDPDKVTIYGESSGAISVSHQILAFQGQHNNLFRAAICHSGTALPVGRLSEGTGQEAFDRIAADVGCQAATEKLPCLRRAPFEKILKAVDGFPGTFSFSAFPLIFAPAVDGEFVTESVQHALKAGRFARIPVISGNTLDEGTFFALATLPLRSENELRTFITEKFGDLTSEVVSKVLELWPADPALGSPFASGDKYALTPVYKQYAALLGDIGFQGLRRLFMSSTSSFMPTWSFIDRSAQHLPILGAFHSSDLPALFGFGPGGQKEEYQTRWIAFANTLDPNYPGFQNWPTYARGAENLIIDKDGSPGTEPDTFRSEAIHYYLENIDVLRLISD